MIYDLRFKKKIKTTKNIVKILLANRSIKAKKEIGEFLEPKLENVTSDSVGIDKKQLKKAVLRIRNAIKNKESIIVFGDYDVDGISGTAILWEALNSLGAKVMPYIPHRIDEGYGLSVKGIQNVILNLFQDLKGTEIPKPSKRTFLSGGGAVRNDTKGKLIITVDNGIVANKAVEFANKNNIDVIITDHHVPSKKLPNALAIVHTTKLCGTGVAWLFSRVILNLFQDLNKKEMLKSSKRTFLSGGGAVQHDNERHLELVALATVADLVPLKGANRTLLKFGLEALRKTKRIGLLELFKEAGLEKETIGVYEIGHIIAPRLNAAGRLDYAMDSLRLLCTRNKDRAEMLARKLGQTNKERQLLTIETTRHAIESMKNKKVLRKLLFVVHESYQQGVVGLVAGRLVEEFYRPAIVISKGEKYSKASARSIKGFNIIEFIRGAEEFLVDAGGHPMAAGFTIETKKLAMFEEFLHKKADGVLDGEALTRKLRIDCELPLSLIDIDLYESLQKLAPFGMGNPEPVFVSKNVVIEDMRLVGMEGKHLKMNFKFQISNFKFGRIEGIGFGMGERASEFKIGDKVSIVYVIDNNEWNGEQRLQLKIKDIRSL